MKKFTLIEKLRTGGEFRFPDLTEEELNAMTAFILTRWPDAKLRVEEEKEA